MCEHLVKQLSCFVAVLKCARIMPKPYYSNEGGGGSFRRTKTHKNNSTRIQFPHAHLLFPTFSWWLLWCCLGANRYYYKLAAFGCRLIWINYVDCLLINWWVYCRANDMHTRAHSLAWMNGMQCIVWYTQHNIFGPESSIPMMIERTHTYAAAVFNTALCLCAQMASFITLNFIIGF